MATTLIATLGALLGALVGAWASQASAKSTAHEASRRFDIERLDLVAGRVADAYAQAREAVEWLSSDHVEDSTLPTFRDELEPQYEEAMEKLVAARRELNRLAVVGHPSIAIAATNAATLLGELGDAWRRGRSWSNHYHSRQADDQTKKRYGDILSKQIGEIDAARDSLLHEHGALEDLRDVTQRVLPGAE